MWTDVKIPQFTRFGPYEGVKQPVKDIKQDEVSGYGWLVSIVHINLVNPILSYLDSYTSSRFFPSNPISTHTWVMKFVAHLLTDQLLKYDKIYTTQEEYISFCFCYTEVQ